VHEHIGVRSGPGQFFVARVGNLWVWKISPKNPKKFNLFSSGHKKSRRFGSKSTRVKDRLASYLLRVKSMLGSGQGPSLVRSCSPFVNLSPLSIHFEARELRFCTQLTATKHSEGIFETLSVRLSY